MSATLRNGFEALGLPLNPEQERLLHLYAIEVLHWGRRINLTGVRDVREFEARHVLDAVSILPHLPVEPEARWADVGTGAGVPGIPLAILSPRTRWLLVEPREKRWAFLMHVVHRLELERVEVVRARVEDAPVAEGSLDGVVSRALGRPALAALPWLREGGMLALQAGSDLSRWADLPEAYSLRALPLVDLAIPGVDAMRHLLRWIKS